VFVCGYNDEVPGTSPDFTTFLVVTAGSSKMLKESVKMKGRKRIMKEKEVRFKNYNSRFMLI
jgi:hypothetical protein